MLKNIIKRFKKSERGATMMEYSLVVAIIAIGTIVALGAFSGQLSNAFNLLGNSLANQPGVVGTAPGQPQG